MDDCTNCLHVASDFKQEPCATCQEYHDDLIGSNTQPQEFRSDNLFVTLKPLPVGDVEVGSATVGIATDGVFSAHQVGVLTADEMMELAASLIATANQCNRLTLQALEQS